MADLAKVDITATDNTGTAVKSAIANLDSLKGSILSTKSSIAGFAAALGVGTFAFLVKGAIEAQAELDRLSQRTGLTVESLSILKQATTVVGGDFDQVVAGVTKLDKAMYEAATQGGKTAQAFAGLGISVVDASGKLRSSDDVLNEVAKAFAGMEDGALKSALAQVIFGKAGAANIPVLNELGGAIEYVSKVSALQAQIAEDLEKNWNRLTLSGKGVWNTIAGAITPALDGLVKGFLNAINSSGGLREKVAQLAADGSLAAWAQKAAIIVAEYADAVVDVINVASRIPTTLGSAGTYFKGFAEVVAGGYLILSGQIQRGSDLAATGLEEMKAGFDGVGKAIADFAPSTKFKDAVVAGIVEMSQFAEKARGAVPPLEAFSKAHAEAAESLKKLLAPLIALQDALGKEGAQLDAQLASLQQYGIATKETEVATTLFEIEQGKLKDAFAALYAVTPLLADALKALLIQQAAHNDATKTAIELEKQYLDARKKHLDSLVQGIDAIQKEIDAEKQRGAAIGLTRAEVIDLAIAQEQANDLTRTTIEVSQEDVKAQELRIAKLRELRGLVANNDAVEASRKTWGEFFTYISDRAQTFGHDVIESGWGQAFKNLIRDAKALFVEFLVKLAAQQFILNIAPSFGSAAASAATSAFSGAGGGGSSITNLISGGGGSLLGQLPFVAGAGPLAGSGTGIAGALAGAGFEGLGAFAAGLGSPIATITTAATAGIAAAGGIAAIAGAAVPVIGIALAAAYALGAFDHGGPKGGGSASSGVNLGTGESLANTGFGRFFTPADSDATVQQIVDSVTKTYANVAKTLGLSLGSASFGLGFDTDPQGKAQNRISAGAFVGTQQVYNVQNLEVGRDADTLKQDLALEAQRALLAALQASDLPKYLSTVLNSVAAAGASQDQINSIIATAQALKQAVDTVSGLGDQFKNLDPEQIKGLVDAFGSLQNFTQGFAYLSANFETSAQRAQQATDKLNTDFAALGVQVPKNHADFLALLNSLNLTDPAQQKLYASLVNLAPEFVAVAGTADQAAAALKKQVDSAQQFFNQNFFSGAEQASQRVDAAWGVVHQAWTAMGAQLLALGYDHIPTTNAGFRALIATVLAVDGADSDLYKTLIQLAPTIFGLNQDLGTLDTTAAGASDSVANLSVTLQGLGGGIAQDAQNAFGQILSGIDSLVGQVTGGLGAQLGTRITLYQEQIARYQAMLATANAIDPTGQLFNAILAAIHKLGSLSTAAAAELARLTVLTAQYGPAIAEQLVQLEQWRDSQLALFAGMPDALAALDVIFHQKWDAIVNGTQTGVNNLLDQYKRIRDFLDSLTTGALSPLTPYQRFQEAQTQYQTQLGLAQGGNANAIGSITQYAQTYLQLAQSVFASSSAYTSIFNAVTSALAALLPAGVTPSGSVTVAPTASASSSANYAQALTAALPTSSRIASGDDVKALITALEDKVDELITSDTLLLTALANASSKDVQAQTQTLKQKLAALADAQPQTLK